MRMSRRENFYRRNPGDALAGMAAMTLEERGVYNTVIDLIYLTWRPLEDNRRYIAGHCGCAVQKVNPIVDRLIASGKLIRFEEGGVSYISNGRFEAERAEVREPVSTRSGRAKAAPKSREVGEKSAGVEEKSAGVEENLPLLSSEVVQFQHFTALEEEEEEEEEVERASAPTARVPRAVKGRRLDDGWTPSPDDVAYAARMGFSPTEIDRMASRFRNYWTSKPGAGAVKTSWSRTWQNWVLSDAERRPAPVKRVGFV